MLRRDYRDIVCGLLLAAAGAAAAWYAMANYQLGTLARMGPGLSFVALGITLALFGALIAIPALFRAGAPVRAEVRPFIAIVAAMAVFPFVLPAFGLLPAIAATTIVASLADGRAGVRNTLLLAAFLVALCYAIFILGLRLNMTPFRLPF
jgi:hypothetical protein